MPKYNPEEHSSAIPCTLEEFTSAVASGSSEAVDKLYFTDIILFASEAEGKTHLHMAAENGAWTLYSYLIEQGLNPEKEDRNGNTAIIGAITKRQHSFLRAFLQTINRDVRDTHLGDVALKPLYHAVKLGDLEAVQIFAEHQFYRSILLSGARSYRSIADLNYRIREFCIPIETLNAPIAQMTFSSLGYTVQDEKGGTREIRLSVDSLVNINHCLKIMFDKNHVDLVRFVLSQGLELSRISLDSVDNIVRRFSDKDDNVSRRDLSSQLYLALPGSVHRYIFENKEAIHPEIVSMVFQKAYIDIPAFRYCFSCIRWKVHYEGGGWNDGFPSEGYRVYTKNGRMEQVENVNMWPLIALVYMTDDSSLVELFRTNRGDNLRNFVNKSNPDIAVRVAECPIRTISLFLPLLDPQQNFPEVVSPFIIIAHKVMTELLRVETHDASQGLEELEIGGKRLYEADPEVFILAVMLTAIKADNAALLDHWLCRIKGVCEFFRKDNHNILCFLHQLRFGNDIIRRDMPDMAYAGEGLFYYIFENDAVKCFPVLVKHKLLPVKEGRVLSEERSLHLAWYKPGKVRGMIYPKNQSLDVYGRRLMILLSEHNCGMNVIKMMVDDTNFDFSDFFEGEMTYKKSFITSNLDLITHMLETLPLPSANFEGVSTAPVLEFVIERIAEQHKIPPGRVKVAGDYACKVLDEQLAAVFRYRHYVNTTQNNLGVCNRVWFWANEYMLRKPAWVNIDASQAESPMREPPMREDRGDFCRYMILISALVAWGAVVAYIMMAKMEQMALKEPSETPNVPPTHPVFM